MNKSLNSLFIDPGVGILPQGGATRSPGAQKRKKSTEKETAGKDTQQHTQGNIAKQHAIQT